MRPASDVVWLLCLAMCLIAAGQQWKSEIPIVTDKRGFWRPMYFHESGALDSPFSLRAAETRLVNEQLGRLAAVFTRINALNPPMGFEVHPSAHIRPYRWEESGRPGPAPSYLEIPFYGYFEVCDPKCRVALGTAAEPLVVIIVSANSIGSIEWRGRPGWRDEQGPMFLEPRLIGHVADFPKYDDDFVVLNRILRPMWLPVTQERFIRSEIRRWKTHLAEVKSAPMASPYQQWLKEKDQRAKAAEEAYEEMRKRDPKAAEAYRAQMAKVEEEVTAKLTAEEATRVSGSLEGVEFARRQIAALEAELASLPLAGGRLAPAQYLGSIHRDGRPSGLAAAGTEGARPVVMPNRDFFDPGRPKTSLQLLAVRIEPNLEMRREHVSHYPWTNDVFTLRLQEDVIRDVDWTLLASLLDEDSRGTRTGPRGRNAAEQMK